MVNAQWKVAYADFATAMMAFFMLLWLMSNSEKVSLQGLADYFSPSNATMSNSSGAGDVLGGTSLGPDGGKSQGSRIPDNLAPAPRSVGTRGFGTEAQPAPLSEANAPAAVLVADPALIKAEAAVRTALSVTPELVRLRDSIVVEQTPEGLRIQLTDTAARPMFAQGSAEPNGPARVALGRLGQVLARQPQRLVIQGHSDSLSAGAQTSNWALSAARADAARQIFAAQGVANLRIAEVAGRADTDPLYPMAPERPENRRITVILLREAPPVPDDFGRGTSG